MPRRASKHISLVLIGSASLLAGCSPSPQNPLLRDHYGSVEDCAADWGRPENCEPAYGGSSSGGGGYIFRGPAYYGGYRTDAQTEARQQAGKAGLAPSDRSISRVTAPSGTARSGFGSSARSYSSSGS